MPQELRHTIDFFYTVRTKDEALFLSEILEAAQQHHHFRAHLHYSADQGRLTAENIAKTAAGNIAVKHIYMCGPSSMLAAFKNDFRRKGVPSNAIHYEEFIFR